MFPEVYAKRRINRGFEGLAIVGELIYAFIQGPLDNPDVPNDATSRASKNARIMVFNTTSRSVTEEYMYVFSPIPGN
jgi:3-phytase